MVLRYIQVCWFVKILQVQCSYSSYNVTRSNCLLSLSIRGCLLSDQLWMVSLDLTPAGHVNKVPFLYTYMSYDFDWRLNSVWKRVCNQNQLDVKLKPASDYTLHGMYDGYTHIHFALAVLSVWLTWMYVATATCVACKYIYMVRLHVCCLLTRDRN